MEVLLIAATEMEIGPYASSHGTPDILITGVGIVATLYHLQKRLQQIRYHLVIQAGIAGSFTEETATGQTVLVKQDCFGDMGIEQNKKFTTVFEEGFGNADEFPFEKGWLINPHVIFGETLLPVVNGVTVNKVSDDPLQKQQLIQKFSPGTESMEGAALHYVCLQEKTAFLQIRGISNYVGERDRAKWKMKTAIENMNGELKKIIDGFTGL